MICVTCGTQYPPGIQPRCCPICEDERQYVGWNGQQWTTLAELRTKHRNEIAEEDPGLHSIVTVPAFAINQRAFLVQTPDGNLLWDCVALLDDATLERVHALGGIQAIAVSHPHYYTTMVEWSHAFGKAPVYIHERDREWVMRPDPVVRFWEGETYRLFSDLTLVWTGGHFEGFQVLHWPAGAGGKGALLAGDQPQVAMNRRWVGFLYSYPNFVPLGARAVRLIGERLGRVRFDRLYGAFAGRAVMQDAQGAVERSIARHLETISR